MAVNFRAIGNFFTVVESATDVMYICESLDSIKYFRDENDVFSFYPKQPNGNTTLALNTNIIGLDRNNFPFADILDFRTGSAFTSADALETYLASILGQFSQTGALTNVGYGLFSQTAQGTTINNTTEQDLLGVGVGSLLIPANTLEVGSTYHLKLGGLCHLTGGGNRTTMQVRIKNGATILADSGLVLGEHATNLPWQLEIDFVIRTIGASGTIMTNANFTHPRDSNPRLICGFLFQDNETINTTIDNTLSVTWEFVNLETNDQIYTSQSILNKLY